MVAGVLLQPFLTQQGLDFTLLESVWRGVKQQLAGGGTARWNDGSDRDKEKDKDKGPGGAGASDFFGTPALPPPPEANMATPGWGTPSTAGAFRSYTVTPAPGAVALLALAGLGAGRRRK